MDNLTKNITSPRRCYTCTDISCLRIRETKYITEGGQQNYTNTTYKAWRENMDRATTLGVPILQQLSIFGVPHS